MNRQKQRSESRALGQRNKVPTFGGSKRHRLYVLAVILIAVAIWASIAPVETTFEISCNTDVVRLMQAKGEETSWFLNEATVDNGAQDSMVPFSGTVRMVGPVKITAQRIGTGPLLLHLRAIDRGKIYLDSSSGTSNARKELLVRLEDIAGRLERGESIVLFVRGDLVLGTLRVLAGHQFTPLLRSCEVKILGTALGGGRRFVAAEHNVGLGSRVSLIPKPGDARSIVVANENPSLLVSAHTISESVEVTGPGRKGYRLGLTFLDRFRSDPLLIALWALVGGIVVLTGLREVVAQRGQRE